MKVWISIYVIAVMHLFVYCGASLHTYGNKKAAGTRRIYHRTLIYDANEVPKDYTLIFKCVGNKYQGISYLEIDVNVESTGFVNETDWRKDFEARIEIKNVLNVTATVALYVSSQTEMNSRLKWVLAKENQEYFMNSHYEPNSNSYYRLFPNDKKENYFGKSLTFIYKKNSKRPQQPAPFAQNAIGRRRKGDKLVYFESRNVTNISRFPSRVFEYSGSEYITYVGFSFNSPTAIAMINTSYIGDQEFNAVACDMNTEHFVANMSVYGIRSVLKPANFKGLIYRT